MTTTLPVPIVVVGSQRSSDRPSSDAALNLIYAVRAAGYGDIAEPAVWNAGLAATAASGAIAGIVNVDFLAAPFGMEQGFEHLDFASSETNEETRRAGPTTDAALAWLDDRTDGGPYFLWVHYFDPHAPYGGTPAHRAGASRRSRTVADRR